MNGAHVHPLRGLLTGAFVAALLAGCATQPTEDRVPAQACVTELPGFAPYNGDDCRACENVHVAAPGEPRRCGLQGKRPGEAPDEDADRDGDGVADRRDACLATPEGRPVLANGCTRLELTGLRFPLDSAELTSAAREALAGPAEVLRRSPGVEIEIAGHTDDQGGADYNRRLSRARAAAVRDWLAGRGIAEDRLRISGYGASEPVAGNDTADGRARNRRVELRAVATDEGEEE
ncbi:MAG: OmpA family protein [Halofilum sp. (in: g-proteobacteria)]|nr:OmpA family protein [Halofilum sp. (in: g-proteobacteria)]